MIDLAPADQVLRPKNGACAIGICDIVMVILPVVRASARTDGVSFSWARDPKAYGANRRQSARLVRRGRGRVQIVARALRYPAAYPREKPEEKGIDVALAVDFAMIDLALAVDFAMMAARDEYDVGILMSTDTDLVPALEAVSELRGPRCEVAAWKNPRGGSSRLAVRGHDVPCHWLEAADYAAVFDDTDYTVS